MTKLYEAGNHILIHAGYADPAEHRHMAAHVLLSMDGAMLVTSKGTSYPCHGVAIPSGVPHAVNTFGNDVLVFLYDCTTPTAKQIRHIQCIPEEACRRIADLYAAVAQNCTADSYGTFEKSVLAQLGIREPTPAISDERIHAAIRYIRARSSERVLCQEVADAVHLSQSRFSHLFKEQAGMTFAAYLICQRIIHVYTQLLRGKSITEAAIGAGFSSSAHFAEVNRRIFGISASAITHGLVFTKVQ